MNLKFILGLLLFNLTILHCATQQRLSIFQMYLYATLLVIAFIFLTEVITPKGGIVTNIFRVLYKVYSTVKNKLVSSKTKLKYSFQPTYFNLGPIQKAAIIRALIISFVIFLILWILNYFLRESTPHI